MNKNLIRKGAFRNNLKMRSYCKCSLCGVYGNGYVWNFFVFCRNCVKGTCLEGLKNVNKLHMKQSGCLNCNKRSEYRVFELFFEDKIVIKCEACIYDSLNNAYGEFRFFRSI
jgi:ribosomal protein S14